MMRTETDSGSNSYKIPIHADFLIAYSTIPGKDWFVLSVLFELSLFVLF